MDTLFQKYKDPDVDTSPWPVALQPLFQPTCEYIDVPRQFLTEDKCRDASQILIRAMPVTNSTLVPINSAIRRMAHRTAAMLNLEEEVALDYPLDQDPDSQALLQYPHFAEEKRELDYYVRSEPSQDPECVPIRVGNDIYHLPPPKPMSQAMTQILLNGPFRSASLKSKHRFRKRQNGVGQTIEFVYKFRMSYHHSKIDTLKPGETHYRPAPNYVPNYTVAQRQMIRELHITLPGQLMSRSLPEYEAVALLPTWLEFEQHQFNVPAGSVLDPMRAALPRPGLITSANDHETEKEHPFFDKLPRNPDGSYAPLPHSVYDNTTTPLECSPFKKIPFFNPFKAEQPEVEVVGRNGEVRKARLPIQRSHVGLSPFDYGGYCREQKGYNVPGIYTDDISHKFVVMPSDNINGINPTHKYVGRLISAQPIHNFNPRQYVKLYVFMGRPSDAYPENRRGIKTPVEWFKRVDTRMNLEWNATANPDWKVQRMTVNDLSVQFPSPQVHHPSGRRLDPPPAYTSSAADVLTETQALRCFDSLQDIKAHSKDGYLPVVIKQRLVAKSQRAWHVLKHKGGPSQFKLKKGQAVPAKKKASSKKPNPPSSLLSMEDDEVEGEEEGEEGEGEEIDDDKSHVSIDTQAEGEGEGEVEEEGGGENSDAESVQSQHVATKTLDMIESQTHGSDQKADKLNLQRDPSKFFIRPGDDYTLFGQGLEIYKQDDAWAGGLEEYFPLYDGKHAVTYQNFLVRMQREASTAAQEVDVINVHLQFFETFITVPFGLVLLALNVSSDIKLAQLVRRYEPRPLVAEMIWRCMKLSLQYTLGQRTPEEALVMLGILGSPPSVQSVPRLFHNGQIILQDRFYPYIVYGGPELSGSPWSREEQYRIKFRWCNEHKLESFLIDTMQTLACHFGWDEASVLRTHDDLRYVTAGETLDFNYHWALARQCSSFKKALGNAKNLPVFMHGDPSMLIGAQKLIKEQNPKRRKTQDLAGDAAKKGKSSVQILSHLDTATERGFISAAFTKGIQYYSTRHDAKRGNTHGSSPIYQQYQPHNEAKAVEALCKINNLNSSNTKTEDKRTKPDSLRHTCQLDTQLKESGAISQKLCMGSTITNFEHPQEVEYVLSRLRYLKRDEFNPCAPSELRPSPPDRPWVRVRYKDRPVGYTLHPYRVWSVLDRIKSHPDSSPDLHVMTIATDQHQTVLEFRLDQGLVASPLLQCNTQTNTIRVPKTLWNAWKHGRLPFHRPHTGRVKYDADGNVVTNYTGHDYSLPDHIWYRDMIDCGMVTYATSQQTRWETVGSSTQDPVPRRYITVHPVLNLSPTSTLLQYIQHSNPIRVLLGSKKVLQSNSYGYMLASLYGDVHENGKPRYYILWPQRGPLNEFTAVAFLRPLVGAIVETAMISDGFDSDDAITAIETSGKNEIVCMLPHGMNGKVFVGVDSVEAFYQLVSTMSHSSLMEEDGKDGVDGGGNGDDKKKKKKTKQQEEEEAFQQSLDGRRKPKKPAPKKKQIAIHPTMKEESLEEKEEEKDIVVDPPSARPSAKDVEQKKLELYKQSLRRMFTDDQAEQFRAKGILFMRSPNDEHVPFVADKTLIDSEGLKRNRILREQVDQILGVDGLTQTMRVGQPVRANQALCFALRLLPQDMTSFMPKLKAVKTLMEEDILKMQELMLDKFGRHEVLKLSLDVVEDNSILAELHFIETCDAYGTYLVNPITSTTMEFLGQKWVNYFLDKGCVSIVLPRHQSLMIHGQGGFAEIYSDPHGVVNRRNMVRNMDFQLTGFWIDQPDARSLYTGLPYSATASFGNEFYQPDTREQSLKRLKAVYGARLSPDEWRQLERLAFYPGAKRPEDFEMDDRHLNPASPGSGWKTFEEASRMFHRHPILVAFQRRLARQCRAIQLYLAQWFPEGAFFPVPQRNPLPYHQTYEQTYTLTEVRKHKKLCKLEEQQHQQKKGTTNIASMPFLLRRIVELRHLTLAGGQQWWTINQRFLDHAVQQATQIHPQFGECLQRHLPGLFKYYIHQCLNDKRQAFVQATGSEAAFWFDFDSEHLHLVYAWPSVQEIGAFWRRWLSVQSAWFKDYVLAEWKPLRCKELLYGILNDPQRAATASTTTTLEEGEMEAEQCWDRYVQYELGVWIQQWPDFFSTTSLFFATTQTTPNSFWWNLLEAELRGQLEDTWRVIRPKSTFPQQRNASHVWSQTLMRAHEQVFGSVPELYIRSRRGTRYSVWTPESWLVLNVDLGDAELDPVLLIRSPRERREVWYKVCRSGMDGTGFKSKIIVGPQLMHQIGISAEMGTKTFKESSLDPHSLEPVNKAGGGAGVMEVDTLLGNGAGQTLTDTTFNNSVKLLTDFCKQCEEETSVVASLDPNRPITSQMPNSSMTTQRVTRCMTCGHSDPDKIKSVYVPKIMVLNHYLGLCQIAGKYVMKKD